MNAVSRVTGASTVRDETWGLVSRPGPFLTGRMEAPFRDPRFGTLREMFSGGCESRNEA